jgi:hypothetical protein
MPSHAEEAVNLQYKEAISRRHQTDTFKLNARQFVMLQQTQAYVMITKDEDDGRHGLKRYATFIRQTKD